MCIRDSQKTGLVVDAYFSATKIAWLIENEPQVAKKVKTGEAVFGTVDSWLIYQLSKLGGEAEFVTEPSNASRTMLFNIAEGKWDSELLELFGISEANLAKVRPSAGEFCKTKIKDELIPVLSVLGDQQASLYGLSCDEPGQAKCTFGTGAFMLSFSGGKLPEPEKGILSTVAWQKEKELTYALSLIHI